MNTLFVPPTAPLLSPPRVSPRSTTFLPVTLAPTRARARRPPATARGAPLMLLGIPRVFGRRVKDEQRVQTVETTPAPLPEQAKKEGALQWAHAHPFQAAALVSLCLVLVRRSIAVLAPNSAVKDGANVGAASTVAQSASKGTTSNASKGSRLRAVPRRHETTEEALDLLGNTARKYIIVGGKGGVGKTSMSAAVATAFADRGQTTLIVSTDPAHSLSDAFGQSVSGGEAVPVLGIDNLYAQEVDPESMKATFKMMQQMEGATGMEEMGLDDLNSLFDTIPPGFDEAVALVEIVKYIEADAEYAKFDRIVFDTAPTGHTLRLLALPDFLNGFFGKMISMKNKFGNVMNQFKGMFGSGSGGLDSSVEDMEELKRSMNMVRQLFRDELQTEFVVATIPNMMAISESKRLLDELRKECIPVRHLFVNQMQPENDGCTFCAARYKEQSSNMRLLEREFDGLQIATVQSFDKEIKGAGALRAMGAQLFPQSAEQLAAAAAAAATAATTTTTTTTTASAAAADAGGGGGGGTATATAELVE